MIAHIGPIEEIYVKLNIAEAVEDFLVDEALVVYHVDRPTVAQLA
jgi:hypothetical protein